LAKKSLEDISGLPLKATLDQLGVVDKNRYENHYTHGSYFIGEINFQAYLRRLYIDSNNVDNTTLNEHGRAFGALIHGLYSRNILPYSSLLPTGSMTISMENSLQYPYLIPILNNSPISNENLHFSAPLRTNMSMQSFLTQQEYNKLKVYTDASLIRSSNPVYPHTGISSIFVHQGSSIWFGTPKVLKISEHRPFLPIYSPSSTTLESLAHHQALSITPTNFQLTIYTDSKSAIASQTKISSIVSSNITMSSRDILKIPNNLIHFINEDYISTRSQATQFQHVKAHTSDSGYHSLYNNQADLEAKKSADITSSLTNFDQKQHYNLIKTLLESKLLYPNSPYIPPEIAHSHEHLQLFKDGILVLQYPRAFIKAQFMSKNTALLVNKVSESFSAQFQDSIPLDFQAVKKCLLLCSSRSMNSHFLDARFIREEKFRKNIILNQLPTLAQISLWKSSNLLSNQCISCSLGTPETLEHLWVCPHTLASQPELLSHTKKLLKERYNISRNTPLFLLFSSKLGIDSPEFISALHRYIYFPAHTLGPIIEFIKSRYIGKRKNVDDMLHAILDCSLSAFYLLIWCPRSRRIHSGKDPPTHSRPQTTAPFLYTSSSLPQTPSESISSRTRSKNKGLVHLDLLNAALLSRTPHINSQQTSIMPTRKRSRNQAPFFANRRPARLLLSPPRYSFQQSSSSSLPSQSALLGFLCVRGVE
jgi:hypothetical protein